MQLHEARVGDSAPATGGDQELRRESISERMNPPEMIEVVTSDLMDARSLMSDGHFCEVSVDAPYGLSIGTPT